MAHAVTAKQSEAPDGSAITRLRFQKFRAFDDLSVEPLQRITIVTGKNDAGKTALLEGAFILLGEANAEIPTRLAGLRGLGVVTGNAAEVEDLAWAALFRGWDTNHQIVLSGSMTAFGSRRGTRTVTIEMIDQPVRRSDLAQSTAAAASTRSLRVSSNRPNRPLRSAVARLVAGTVQYEQSSLEDIIPAHYLPSRGWIPPGEDAVLFGQLDIRSKTEPFLAALGVIEPHLRRVTSVAATAGALLWGDVGEERLMPLSYLGDGVARLASILLRIAVSEHGVVLIDEVENGFHHSVLDSVWMAIDEASRAASVQVIATTHSEECLAAAARSIRNDDLYVHRLTRTESRIHSTGLDHDQLRVAVARGYELRG